MNVEGTQTDGTSDDVAAFLKDVLPNAGSEETAYRPYDSTDFVPQSFTPPPTSTAEPAKLRKAPKGRFFVGFLLTACVLFGGYQVWGSFFRYRAYGVVVARTIAVQPPWEGIVDSLYVVEGDTVRQGQLLATIDNLELRQRYSKLADDLKVAQATLEAETSRLKWESGRNNHQYHKAAGEYYRQWADYLQATAKLLQMESRYDRLVRLRSANATTMEELELASLAFQGEKKKVEKLNSQLAELKRQLDASNGLLDDGRAQLQPYFARLETLRADMDRVRQRMDQGRLLAPVDGIVIRRHCFAGEMCSESQPVLSIQAAGSLEIVLYLRQHNATYLQLGDGVEVAVDPAPQPLRCTVKRLGDGFVRVPAQIERYYPKNEKLLPVYLQPQAGFSTRAFLRVGGVVALPFTALNSREHHHEGPLP